MFDHQKGSHAAYVRTTKAGSTTIVVPVHKGRTLKRGTLHGFIDDMGLSTHEIIDLLSRQAAKDSPVNGSLCNHRPTPALL